MARFQSIIHKLSIDRLEDRFDKHLVGMNKRPEMTRPSLNLAEDQTMKSIVEIGDPIPSLKDKPQPDFVVGMNGSGTSMLADCLGHHPKLYAASWKQK